MVFFVATIAGKNVRSGAEREWRVPAPAAMSGFESSMAVDTTTASVVPAPEPSCGSREQPAVASCLGILDVRRIEEAVRAPKRPCHPTRSTAQGRSCRAENARKMKAAQDVPLIIRTMVSSGMSLNSSITSLFFMHTHPCDAGVRRPPRCWCRGCKCTARTNRCRAPRLTPSSHPSRRRILERTTLPPGAPMRQSSPVSIRSRNTLPAGAPCPYFSFTRCTPLGVLNDPSALPSTEYRS